MKQTENKFTGFLRRNAVYLILALCIIAIGVSITLMLVKRQNDFDASLNNPPVIEEPNTPSDGTIEEPNTPSDGTVEEPNNPVEKPDDTVTEPVDTPITFVMPVAAPTSIGEYSETMVFNSTLGRFSAHLAVDFYAAEGTDVLVVFDGTVENIETTLLKGTTITVDHGDGLKTVYNSLADGESVKIGQTVKQGDIIGQVSVSNRQEAGAGAHLHFEVLENGKSVDPAKYLVFNEK